MKFTSKVPHPVLDINIYLRENILFKIVLHQFEQIFESNKQMSPNGGCRKNAHKRFFDKVLGL